MQQNCKKQKLHTYKLLKYLLLLDDIIIVITGSESDRNFSLFEFWKKLNEDYLCMNLQMIFCYVRIWMAWLQYYPERYFANESKTLLF